MSPTRPVSAWPRRDRDAWTASLHPGDVLEPGGVAARWAVTTQRLVAHRYGQWLHWLDERGWLDPSDCPGARASAERLAAYVAYLETNVGSYTVALAVENLGRALSAMVPEQSWLWVQRAADRLRATAVSVRNKRARVQSPERLVALGMRLMAYAETSIEDEFPWVRAVAFRDGLMIAFLAHRPVRLANLTAMSLDRHLVRRGAEWAVLFEAVETKKKRGQPIEFMFPTELVPYLEHYLEEYRPILLERGRPKPAPVTGLWVSAHGTKMGAAAIGFQLRDRTATAFGLSLSPHLFRDSAATGIAISAPEHVGIVRAVLGHSGMATSEKHYNLAGTLEAGRRYNGTIDHLLQEQLREQEVAN